MTFAQQALADRVQALARRIEQTGGGHFAMVVWNGDIWAASVSTGIDKERLRALANFYDREATTAEKEAAT